MSRIQNRSFIKWVGVSCAGLVGFFITVALLPRSENSEIETFFFEYLSQFRNPTLTKMVMDVSAMGSFTVLYILTLAFVIPLVLFQHKRSALFIFINSSVALLLPHYLKSIFQRTRPDTIHHLIEISTLSFPSGHALGSTSIYLGFSYVLSKQIQQPSLRKLPYLFMIPMVAAIGLTRIYLGVHYLYDVMGGCLFGLAWTSLMIAVFFTARINSKHSLDYKY